MTGTKRPGCTARRGGSVKGIGREASGEHANVAALCTVVGVSVHSTARRRYMCLRAACEARVRHLWGSMARPVRHRAGPPPKPDVTWDRLPARYLPARLQQPSPKLGMELSPHHSFPEVTVGVVPAPAHHVRFLRTLSSSCLPSPCLRLSRGPWSGITPTSTMQAP